MKGIDSALFTASAPETAAGWLVNEALRTAEFGDTMSARKKASQALNLSSGLGVRILAALALARSGDLAQAQKLADALNKDCDFGS